MKPTSCLRDHKWITVAGEAVWMFKENPTDGPYVQTKILRYMRCVYCCECKTDAEHVRMDINQSLEIPF